MYHQSVLSDLYKHFKFGKTNVSGSFITHMIPVSMETARITFHYSFSVDQIHMHDVTVDVTKQYGG